MSGCRTVRDARAFQAQYTRTEHRTIPGAAYASPEGSQDSSFPVTRPGRQTTRQRGRRFTVKIALSDSQDGTCRPLLALGSAQGQVGAGCSTTAPRSIGGLSSSLCPVTPRLRVPENALLGGAPAFGEGQYRRKLATRHQAPHFPGAPRTAPWRLGPTGPRGRHSPLPRAVRKA